MTRGKRILRTVAGAVMSSLFFLSIVAFFVIPAIRDREAREMLGDPNAIVTDTARSSWIYVDENGTAQILSDRCIGMEELVIPSAVNGIAVTGYNSHFTAKPAWVKRITFPPTLRQIESFPFHEWDAIEQIVFEEGIEDLSDLTVGQKAGLTRLVLPHSLKKINKGLFSYKEHPVEICYAGTKEEWLAMGAAAAYLAERHTMVYGYSLEK